MALRGKVRLFVAGLGVVAALLCPGSSRSQDRGLLLVVVPEEDTTETSSPRYRLSGSTLPGCSVTLNGVPQRVYPSGAFVGLLQLEVGENRFVLRARDPQGRDEERTLLLIRKPPLASTPSDTLAIDSLLLEPREHLWLKEGDILNVQFKGTPGCKATFFDGLPMVEMPDSATNGIRGIYRGSCVVTKDDLWEDTPLVFRLSDSGGSEVTREAPGRLTKLSSRNTLVGITKGDRPFLNYGLGEDRLGGAKMSVINPHIRLAISGKAGNLYRVALA
ncbi:MAG: hypothetical protein IT282_06345, partial [Bacteroidetes bacterium]|nr:hypothetical protein [Bacteroidota bacterium]